MLLDTYSWVEYFEGTSKGKTVEEVLEKESCFTSAISLAELSAVIERKKLDRSKVIPLVKKMSVVLELEHDTLELAGILKFKKRKSVKDFGLVDAIILATAKQYGLKILTGDQHFKGENALML